MRSCYSWGKYFSLNLAQDDATPLTDWQVIRSRLEINKSFPVEINYMDATQGESEKLCYQAFNTPIPRPDTNTRLFSAHFICGIT